MLRFFLGLGFGVVLTVCSLGFMGAGHGTYVPMVFTGSVVALITNFGAIPAIVMAPFLWALYFLLIPRLPTRLVRIAATVLVLSVHVVSGIALAVEDPAFARALSGQPRELLAFGLLLTLAMTFLFYFAARGSSWGQALNAR